MYSKKERLFSLIGYLVERIIKRNRISINLYKFKKYGGKIGSNCNVFSSVVFGSEPYLIEIGNDCRITKGVKFITHDGGISRLSRIYDDMKNHDRFGKIIIGNNVFIGFDVLIMPGVTIGSNVVVGGGGCCYKRYSCQFCCSRCSCKSY